jgi:RNA polymerase sporulation-specific sigma factor
MAGSKKVIVKNKANKTGSCKTGICSNVKTSSKKKDKILTSSILDIEKIESESIELVEVEVDESKHVERVYSYSKDMAEQIMFRLPCVSDPIIGTPKQVQKELDALAKKMQKRPSNDKIFDKIHLYMHGYLINMVLKKFPFIKGFQTVDIYQETLMALRFKAIPGFEYDKGMSFLNFAKMCIRRHLITLLHASKNKKKDQALNQAISLDSSPNKDDDEDSNGTYANIISDKKESADRAIETNEAYEVTKKALWDSLSEFERTVLSEYLSSSSYKEISKSISKAAKSRANPKSIDNALLRIRKKAIYLKKHSRMEDLPIFLPKKSSNN